jgi:hypothetical protein
MAMIFGQTNLKLSAAAFFLLCTFPLSCKSTTIGKTYVEFQLNEYIKIATPTYFVKVLFHSILSENLGPSNVPITLVTYNKTQSPYTRARSWCQFLPGHSFIGTRTENTLNIILSDMDVCYQYSKLNREETNKCDILRFVVAGLHDRSSTGGNCKVSTDKMYTLLLAEDFRRDVVTNNLKRFWTRFQLKLFPYSIFIFYSFNHDVKKVCSFTSLADSIGIHCLNFRIMPFKVFVQLPVGSKSWKPDVGIANWRQKNTYSLSKWDWYYGEQIDEMLVLEILRKANETGNLDDWSTASIGQHYDWKELNKQYVLVDTFKLSFLSCYSEHQVDFEMYVKPFDVVIWISLGVCCACIAAIMYLYKSKHQLSTSFSPVFFLLSSPTEDSYPIPEVLLNTKIYKIFALAWLLPTVVLTNLYTGLVISDVTSPLRGEILTSFEQIFERKWDNFTPVRTDISETANFWKLNYSQSNGIKYMMSALQKRICKDPFDSQSYDLYQDQFRDKKSFALLQMPVENCAGSPLSVDVQQRYLSHPWIYSEFDSLFHELSAYLVASIRDVKRIRYLLAFFSPKNRHYPRDPKFSKISNLTIHKYAAAAIEKELVACKWSVFVGKTHDLQFELSYLKSNYPRKNFYEFKKSFETDGSKPVVWSFTDAGRSMVPISMKI